MEQVIELQGFRIVPEFSEREVNFVVSDRKGYLFRLVPNLAGFDLSPLDRALGTNVDQQVVEVVGYHIHSYYY